MFKLREADKRIIKFYAGVRRSSYRSLIITGVLFSIFSAILDLPVRGELSIGESVLISLVKELRIIFFFWVGLLCLDLIATCIYIAYFYVNTNKVDFSKEKIISENEDSLLWRFASSFESAAVHTWKMKGMKKAKRREKKEARRLKRRK